MEMAATIGICALKTKYHIHIYKVESIQEIDVETDGGEQKALEIALKNKDVATFKEPDNKFVALCFDWDLTMREEK